MPRRYSIAQIPDFGALAQQQQQYNDDATRRSTWSNRPDQSGAMGSISWNQMPDGRWVNNTTMTGQAQGLFDATMQGQQGLAGQIGGGLNYGSAPAMPQVGGYNQQVIDSWNALQNPGLQKSEDAARARAAAMGITMGSNAWGDQERSLGNVRTDAGNKAILAGYTQGNTEFDQALRARQQGASEAEKSYGAAISGMGALGTARGDLNPNKWVSDVPTGSSYKPMDIYGAAADSFSAQQAMENQQQAQSNADRSANMGMANTALNLGSQIGWGNIGSGAKSIWDWGSNYFGSSGSDYDWTGSAEYF